MQCGVCTAILIAPASKSMLTAKTARTATAGNYGGMSGTAARIIKRINTLSRVRLPIGSARKAEAESS